MALRWDPGFRAWRENGKLLNFKQTAGLRNEIADLYSQYIAEETDLFLAGKLEYASWVTNVENYVLQATGNGYSFGRGGVGMMGDGDYDRLARTLNTQVDLFRAFADEVAQDTLSDAQIMARAESYGGSAVYAHEQAVNQAAIGDDPNANWELPFYPGDGGSSCLARCRCSWQIDEDEYGWTCVYHSISDGSTCPECEARGEQYGPDSPLLFPKAGAPIRIQELALV